MAARGGHWSKGGFVGGKNGGKSGPSPAEVAVKEFGGRTGGDGSVTLDYASVADAIGFSVKKRPTGSIDRAFIGGQTISANSVSSVQSSMRKVMLTGNELRVRTVGGQAYVTGAYSQGIGKIAAKLGAKVVVKWLN